MGSDQSIQYYESGLQAYKKGDYDKAIEELNRCLDLRSGKKNGQQIAEAYNLLGKTYSKKGKHQEGAMVLKKAIEALADPKDKKSEIFIKVTCSLGDIFLSLNLKEQAIEFYDIATTTWSLIFDTNILKNLQGLYEENETIYEISKAFKNLGILYHENSDKPKSLQSFKTAEVLISMKAGPNHIDMWEITEKLGDAYLENNLIDEGIKEYRKALTFKSQNTSDEDKSLFSLYLKLGEVFEKKNSYDESLSCFKSAYKISKKEYGDKSAEFIKVNENIKRVMELQEEAEALKDLSNYKKNFGKS